MIDRDDDDDDDDSAFDLLHDNTYDNVHEKKKPDSHLLKRPSTTLLLQPRVQTPPTTPESKALDDFASLTPPSVFRSLRRVPLPFLLPAPSMSIPADLYQSRGMPPNPPGLCDSEGQFLSPVRRESQRALDAFPFSPHLFPLEYDQFSHHGIFQQHRFPPRSPVARQPPRRPSLPPLFSPSVLSTSMDETLEAAAKEPMPVAADDESYKESVGSTPPRRRSPRKPKPVRASSRRTVRKKTVKPLSKPSVKPVSKPSKRILNASFPRGPSREELESASNQRSRAGMFSWWTRYYELCAFLQSHGHTNVPQVYKPNRQLGIWVNKQRMERKFLDQHKASSMTRVRLEALDALGFVWAKRKGEVAWRLRFEQLLEYRSQHGHCQVPTKYAGNRPLGRWVSTQRSLSKKGELVEEHYQQLREIGFIFDALSKPEDQEDEPQLEEQV